MRIEIKQIDILTTLISGDHLQSKYDVATFVKPTKRGRLKVKKDSGNIPTANDLVFLKKSPDYCHANPTIGSLGKLKIMTTRNLTTNQALFYKYRAHCLKKDHFGTT
jgi:hypothetical protein